MKIKTLNESILILSCFFFSCKDKKEMDGQFFQIIEEKETTFSTGQLVFEEEMQQFIDMHVTDSFAFLTSQRNDKPITVLSLKNFERVEELGDRGQGPESLDFPLFLKDISKKGKVELLDLNRRTLIHIGRDFEMKKYTLEKEMIPDSLWPSINLNKISDTLYFANSLEPFNKGLYFKWNRCEIGIDVDKRKNSKIFIFDWNLDHVSTIQVDQPLAALDVDLYDRYILGLFSDDQEDSSIYKFDIEL